MPARFRLDGTRIEIAIHPGGRLAFYLDGKWLCGGVAGVALKRLLLDGLEPEGSIFDGTHKT